MMFWTPLTFTRTKIVKTFFKISSFVLCMRMRIMIPLGHIDFNIMI